jgi:hypothetical protein
MAQSMTVPGRFNGPVDSGNGGYSAGVIAGFLDGPAEVSLRSPVPLDTPLDVVGEDGSGLRVVDADTLVAEARSVPDLEVEVPAPASPEDARQAATRYRGVADGPFSHCFVCGRARGDAFGVFAGEVEGRSLVASPWTPPSWTADQDGRVLPEFVWAVLDCPTYFAAHLHEELPMSVLALLAARIDGEVMSGDEHVVMAWPVSVDGRKRHAGAAVLSADGKPLAVAHALMVELREP